MPKQHLASLMACKMKFFLALFLIVVLVKTGHSINCFECDSEHDPSCKDPFTVGTTILSKDCSQLELRVGQNNENAGFGDLPGTPADRTGQQAQDKINCFKVTIEITARGCGFMGHDEQCPHITKEVTSKKGKVKHCSTCNKNECNSAPRNILSTTTSLILIPAVILALRAQMQ
ncbi:hypothetical protein B566_EDAN007727 [Ephemera danica]|nr:hypothetical protein B566_EDAN007727 [Ephemera danica]